MNQSKANELLSQVGRKSKRKSIDRLGKVCVSYNRVSSKDQMVNGNSLFWQNERIEEFAQKNGYQIKSKYGGTFESAKTDERKEFKKMIVAIQKDSSISTILVYSYDRFSRSGSNGLFLLENLKKLGVSVVSITQEIDSSTPTGEFQEGLYMLLSKLDNDMRKQKCAEGIKSILLKGFWPFAIPTGYENLNKRCTADKHMLVITEAGKLIAEAFKWKATGRYTNLEILNRLQNAGLKLRLRNLTNIFSNPFYCGYIISGAIHGEVIRGHHPPIVDEETFLRANAIFKRHPLSGIPKQVKNDALPLKVFLKDEKSGCQFTGYMNKKRKIHYYKVRQYGVGVNVRADLVHEQFIKFLQSFEFNPTIKAKLENLLIQEFSKVLSSQNQELSMLKKQITELKQQIEILEERFVLGQISAEQFEKFKLKYSQQLREIEKGAPDFDSSSSNLENAVSASLKLAQNLSQVWVSADYIGKQQLQYLLFPDGALYNKETNRVRTFSTNVIFREIPIKSRGLDKKQKGNPDSDYPFGSQVELQGVEPWSKQNRQTLSTCLFHDSLSGINRT